MKIKIMLFIVWTAILAAAQTSANPATPKSDTPSSQPSACQKMMQGKMMDSCCMKTAESGKEKMSCCQGKASAGKESKADVSDAKSEENAMSCCQGKDAKDAMACMKGDKDKESKMSCGDGKCGEGTNMKDCCAKKGADQTQAMEHCPMMAQHDHSDMK